MKIKTACGGSIVITRTAASHLRAHPEVEQILPEAIGKVRLPRDESFLAIEVEMGRIVGRSGCVKTAPIGRHEKAFFAQRIGRDKPSRVLPDAAGEETSKVVVLAFAAKGEPGLYILVTSFIGSLAPKEPWDQNIRSQQELEESLGFWSSHALTHDSEVMGSVFESSWHEVLR